MDTTETITHIGLCAGYGGIELGLKRVLPTLRTVALCEIEAFAIANLVAKMETGLMDPAPIWSNLKTFPWAEFCDRVDILTGGYPCQPFSAAGKRLGADDERHLWPYITDGIRLLRPRVCFFENVEGHISLGLREVIADLESLGYRTTWGLFSAAEVGAPHQRKRVFILAHRSGEGLQGCGRFEQIRLSVRRKIEEGHSSKSSGFGSEIWPSRPGEPQHAWEPPRVVADASSKQSKRGGILGELESQTSPEQGEAQKRQWSRHSTGNQSADGMPSELGNTSSDGRQHDQQSEDGRQAGAVAESSKSLGNPESGARLGRASGDKGHAAQPDESVGDASSERPCGGTPHGFGQQAEMSGAGHESLGDAENNDWRHMPKRDSALRSELTSRRQTQSPLGGDANGAAGGLDYAGLCESCDNRTDELRLLGNGVVPATAALAFRTLLSELEIQN